METLPSEIISEFYSKLSPRSYRRFQQTSTRNREIGEDPYSLRQSILKGTIPNGFWVTKADRKGNCFNSLTISEFRYVDEEDLIKNTFIYEYRVPIWDSVIVECPFDDKGYLNGLMTITFKRGLGERVIGIPIVEGKAHGRAVLGLMYTTIFDRGVDTTNDNIFSLEGRENFIIYYKTILNPDITGLTDENGYNNLYDVPDDKLLGYLPHFLTSRNIPIYKNNLYDLVLPLGLFRCSSLELIQQDILFLINRYIFYITSSFF